jgi:Xaa-Pro aminopeptidase
MVDADHRIRDVRQRLSDSECQAFVVRAPANLTYLSGFDGVWDDEPFSLLLVTADDAVVFTDSRYVDSAEQAATGTPWRVVRCIGDPWVETLALVAGSGVGQVAVESSAPYSVVARARELFSAGEIVPVDGWVEGLRAVKDVAEIDRITAAQKLTDAAFDHILGFVAAGMTESHIALELEFFMRANGSEGVAFRPIVASGPNSALPHAHPGSRALQRGDFLKMDFGARVGGYCSDMTRTVVVGQASARQREIYATVLAANLAGIAAVLPGLPGRDIDAAARGVIEAAGFAEYFGHGLGHGVGLEVHELPGLGARSELTVPLGSVVTIEPGVYVPGFGGARIEDLVVVEKSGARVLTRSTKELIEL